MLKGSHHCGRVNHVLTGDQAGADREVVDALVQRLELVYVEMDPGDFLVWDASIPHDVEVIGTDVGRMLVIYPRRAIRR